MSTLTKGERNEETVHGRTDPQNSHTTQKRNEGKRACERNRRNTDDALCVEEEVQDMTVSEAKRLRELEHENARLKRLVADQALNIEVLKEVNSKKW